MDHRHGLFGAAAPANYKAMDIGKIGIWFFLDGMNGGRQRRIRAQSREARLRRDVDSRGGRTRAVRPCGLPRGAYREASSLPPGSPISMRATRSRCRRPPKPSPKLSGGRFLLGIGVSHKPLVFNLRGHSYDKPYSYMKEYLPKMKSALYRAPMPKEEVPVVIAALHPKMLATGGQARPTARIPISSRPSIPRKRAPRSDPSRGFARRRR